ncbi:MAG: hypothetical protein MUP33_10735 [Polaromonas sp.]|nr:hypothetical protein [Polaromonas sp.]
MKVHPISQRRWLPLGKASMALVAVCLASQVLAQAAPGTPAYGASATDQAGAAKVPKDRATRPHREVQRVPVKPLHYPSNPQPPVPPRR